MFFVWSVRLYTKLRAYLDCAQSATVNLLFKVKDHVSQGQLEYLVCGRPGRIVEVRFVVSRSVATSWGLALLNTLCALQQETQALSQHHTVATPQGCNTESDFHNTQVTRFKARLIYFPLSIFKRKREWCIKQTFYVYCFAITIELKEIKTMNW